MHDDAQMQYVGKCSEGAAWGWHRKFNQADLEQQQQRMLLTLQDMHAQPQAVPAACQAVQGTTRSSSTAGNCDCRKCSHKLPHGDCADVVVLTWHLRVGPDERICTLEVQWNAAWQRPLCCINQVHDGNLEQGQNNLGWEAGFAVVGWPICSLADALQARTGSFHCPVARNWTPRLVPGMHAGLGYGALLCREQGSDVCSLGAGEHFVTCLRTFECMSMYSCSCLLSMIRALFFEFCALDSYLASH